MKKSDNSIRLFNDLLKINTERVERYKRASYDTHDVELKSVFGTIADESRRNITDITRFVMLHYEGAEVSKFTRAGKIYRYWVDAKSKFNGTLRNNLLNSCEFGEMAALAAYRMAEMESVNPHAHELIAHQQESMKVSLSIIRSYRQAFDRTGKILV
jgi:uncharacterized protein (TIGR02284 family)